MRWGVIIGQRRIGFQGGWYASVGARWKAAKPVIAGFKKRALVDLRVQRAEGGCGAVGRARGVQVGRLRPPPWLGLPTTAPSDTERAARCEFRNGSDCG